MNYHEGQGASHTDHNFNAYYLGTVEAINDPKFEGRCKVKVFSLFAIFAICLMFLICLICLIC